VYKERLARYAEFDWYPQQLASLVGETLGVDGYVAVEASFIFTTATDDLASLLKSVKINPSKRSDASPEPKPSAASTPPPPTQVEGVRELPSVREVVDQCYSIASRHNPTVAFFTGLIRSCIGSKELSVYDDDFRWVIAASTEFDDLTKLIETVRLGLLRRMMFS
jgi:hypothetical protein